MKIDIVNKSKNDLPFYSHPGDAGMDLRADFSHINDTMMDGAAYDEKRKVVIVFSGGRILVPTGIFIHLPEGYEAQIRPRSGLAIKSGITVLNTPGTIDSEYIGEICVILLNCSDEIFEIAQGDRIAQMVINKFEKAEWNVVDELTKTERGETGFGDSGIK